MCVFSVVIALFKDIPDVEGDARSAIRTLSVRLGERRVLDICVALLLTAYAGCDQGRRPSVTMPLFHFLTPPSPSAMLFGLFSTALWCRCLMVGAHALLARHLVAVAAGVDTTSGPSLTAAYMALWRLFYAEYMLVPFFGR